MSQYDDDLKDRDDDDYEDDEKDLNDSAARRAATNPFSPSSGVRPSSGAPTPGNRLNDPSRLPGGGGPLPRPSIGGSGTPPGLTRPNPPSFGGNPSGSSGSPLNRPSPTSTQGGSPVRPSPFGGASERGDSGAGRDARPSGGGGFLGRSGGSDDKKDDNKGGGLLGRFGGGGDKPATPKGTARTGDKPSGGGLLGRFGKGGGDKSSGGRPGSAPQSGARFGSAGGSNPAMPGSSPRAPSAPKGPRKSLGNRLKGLSLFNKSGSKQPRQRASKPVSVSSGGMSLDTKLDILGVGLILGSLALVFSAMSSTQGQLTGSVNHFLSQNLGWGAIAVPVVMFGAGVWLILRHFGDNAPTLHLMTLVGIVMLYFGLLVVFQYVESFGYTIDARYSYLDQLRLIYLPQSYLSGRGGGWIGAEIYYFLVSNITEIGGFFMLIAWVIIGVMLALNVSAAQLAMLMISIWRSFSDARRRRAQARAIERGTSGAPVPNGLPQISVSKPADQLAGGRSPQLPAPMSMGALDEERSIPIMQGGRTVSAPFRPGEPVPVEQPFGAQTTAAGLPQARSARADDRPAGSNRFGALASRVRDAIPTPGAKPADNGAAADKSATDTALKAASGLLGSLGARVREAMPGAPNPAAKSSETTEASANGLAGDASTAGQSAVAQVAASLNSTAAPVRSGATFTRPGAPPTASSTSAADRLSGRPSPFAQPPMTDDADEVDEDEEEDGAPPTRLGNLLRPTPSAPASSTGVPRPGLSSPTPAIPRPGFNRPPQNENGPNPPSEATTSGSSQPTDSEARPNGLQSPGAIRPSAATFRPESPTRRADPPEDEDELDEVDDADEADEVDDLTNLPPARPKGTGPLPRPSLSPFQRTTPTTPARGATIPTPQRPMNTLQERMEALRNARVGGESDEDGDTGSSNPATSGRGESETQATRAPDSGFRRQSSDTLESTPADRKPTDATTQAAAPLHDIISPPRPGDDDAKALAAKSESDKPEHAPTLTERLSLGVRGFSAKPENSASPPPTPATPSSAPPAYRMPERPTPPPPARSANFGHPDTPPGGLTPSRLGETPAPPKPLRQGRHDWKMADFGALLVAGSDQELNHDVLLEQAHKIEETLNSFGAPGRVVEVRTGPVITQFGVEPDYLAGRNGKKIRVKVSAIAQLDKDLQLALGAKSIRIEAPVPGKGYVGIEVPNPKPTVVRLRDVLESQEFRKIKSPLAIALGQGVDGTPVAADLASMPHLLIAGTTGSGKSVCVNTIITSLLLKNTPDKLKFIMVDPKRVELTGYNGIPHLVAPVVVELERIVSVLKWVTREMDERYKRFSSAGARNIEDYNKHLPQNEAMMPYIVVIIDELADLMMLAPDETERVITRIAALARATGIHLVIATQRPSVDVVTGLIKANFPARIAFAVAGGVDSRVILDQPGAERLLGRGDMLYMSGDSPAPVRLQGVYVSDNEINNITRFWREQTTESDLAARPGLSAPSMDDTGRDIPASSSWSTRGGAQRQPTQQSAFWDRELSDAANGRLGEDDDDVEDGEDAMYAESVELVRRLGKASVSLLQRRLRIGYTRAARLIDIMEERGIVGPATEGSKPRDVLPGK